MSGPEKKRNGCRVGVLAVQGDFEAHARTLRNTGAVPVLVKHPHEVPEVDALVLPGGESTTALKFLTEEGLLEAIREAAGRGQPLFGTCAGAILLARELTNTVTPGVVTHERTQPCLALMDIAVRRNAYGRQVSSFIARQEAAGWEGGPLEMVFIRAPIIERVGPEVRVLVEHKGWPVLVRQGNLLAATFHPELTADTRIHRYFLQMVPRQ